MKVRDFDVKFVKSKLDGEKNIEFEGEMGVIFKPDAYEDRLTV